jgi:hypothetical protein
MATQQQQQQQPFKKKKKKKTHTHTYICVKPWLRCLALGRLLAFLGEDITAANGGLTSGDRCSCAFVLASSAPWKHSAIERAPIRYALQVLLLLLYTYATWCL